MSVKIEWQVRAAGRFEGDVEEVERTDFVDALISQGRVVVLEESKPEPKAKPKVKEEPGIDLAVSEDLYVVESEDLS